MSVFDGQIIIRPDDIYTANIYLGWGQARVGFGQLSITKLDDGTYSVDNEGMSREWVRRALHAFVDALVNDIPEKELP